MRLRRALRIKSKRKVINRIGDNTVRKAVEGRKKKSKEQPPGLFYHRLRPPARVHINRRFFGASVGAEAQP